MQIDQGSFAEPYNTNDKKMYVADFSVDMSGLSEDYGLVFSLYGYRITDSGVYDKNTIVNPYSHDVIAGGTPVPEPATMLLFGTGLAGLAGVARRKSKK